MNKSFNEFSLGLFAWQMFILLMLFGFYYLVFLLIKKLIR